MLCIHYLVRAGFWPLLGASGCPGCPERSLQLFWVSVKVKKVSDFVHDHLGKGRPPHYVRCGKIMKQSLYCVSVLFVEGIIQKE